MSTKVINKTENEMGTTPVGRLLFKLSLPMILSVLISSLYNLVDSIFVGRLGDNALTAISLATPVATIMLSVAFGISIGVNAILSRQLGEKKFNDVNYTAGNGILLEFICYIVFLLLGIFAVEPFFKMQTSDPAIQSMGVEYTRVIMVASIGLMMQTLMERLLSSTGKTLGSMILLSSGAIINIILDPIMIFGYLGFPVMGMKGAAIATVIGQSCAAIIGLVLNLIWNKEIKFAFNFLKPVGHLIHEIIVIAVPATLTYALNSILAFGMNIILIGYTTVAPAVYIVYTRIQSFIIMPVWGIRNTLVSIVAYNYGAEKKDRVKRAISLSVKTALVVMTIGTLLVEIIPRQLLAAFSDSSEMILIGVPALRVIGITFIISGVTVILNGVFQALGRSDKTFIVSLLQAGSLLLSAVVLGMAHNLTYVWIAFPISEICIYILTKYYYKKISSNLLA